MSATRAYDVAVVGGGNAGLTAALVARELGASVLVLDCAPRALRGGNSRHTRNLRCAHAAPTDVLTESYPEHELMADIERVNGGETDAKLTQLVVERSAECSCVDAATSAHASRRRCAAHCSCRARTRSSSAAARRS